MSRKRPGHAWYSDEDRAKALAIIEAEGASAKQAAERTGLPVRAVQRWAQEYREASSEQIPELMDRHVRRALKVDDLIDAALNHLYEHGVERHDAERLVKQLIALNAVGGTATDKLMKSPQPTNHSLTFVIVKQEVPRAPEDGGA